MARTASAYITGIKNLPQPPDAFLNIIPLLITMPATLASGDLIALTRLNANVRVSDFDIIAPQLDSNGAPTLAFSIGTENAGQTDLGTVWEAGLIFGRTANGSLSRATTAVQLADTGFNVNRTICLKCTTGAATAAFAGKTIQVNLHLVN
jgi:hypothetical protein